MVTAAQNLVVLEHEVDTLVNRHSVVVSYGLRDAPKFCIVNKSTAKNADNLNTANRATREEPLTFDPGGANDNTRVDPTPRRDALCHEGAALGNNVRARRVMRGGRESRATCS